MESFSVACLEQIPLVIWIIYSVAVCYKIFQMDKELDKPFFSPTAMLSKWCEDLYENQGNRVYERLYQASMMELYCENPFSSKGQYFFS